MVKKPDVSTTLDMTGFLPLFMLFTVMSIEAMRSGDISKKQ